MRGLDPLFDAFVVEAAGLHFSCMMQALSMASITIRNLPPTLHEQLKTAARSHHRSLQNEIVACLTRYVEGLPKPRAELMAEAAALRARLPRVDHALVDRFKRAGRA